jgi:hypothetical protein
MFETEKTWYHERDWDSCEKLRHIQDAEYNTLVAKSEQMRDIEEMKRDLRDLYELVRYLENKCDFLESQVEENYYDR